MAAEFDAYHKWLAIPPAEQPPNFYRLLALNPFERDPDVIDSAANARMIHLRSLQSGPQAELTQKLLNEIAAARLCLLKPEKKAAYDAALRAQLARGIAARTPPPLPPRPLIAPPPPLPPIAPSATESGALLLEFISAVSEPGTSGNGAINRANGRRGLGAASWPRWLMVLCPLIGIGIVATAILIRNSSDAQEANVAARNRFAATASAPKTVASAAMTDRPIAPKVVLSSTGQPAATAGRGHDAGVSQMRANHPVPKPRRPTDRSAVAKALLPAVAGNLRLEYRCMQPKSDTNQIRCNLRIENLSEAPFDLAGLKLRYWFAADTGKARNFWCDYAAVDKANVAGRFVHLDRPTETAVGYLELTFSDAAGEIKPGGNSGEIQCRFAADDWSNLDQSKDFSFDPAAIDWKENPRITVYQGGKLIWGQEPARP
ncbi:MAG TPA: cellulose binding domain-containing protein [Pirellulales bacterium]|jgi:hypothetical protein|nr:cellulose binding domain-containing protein [Pirellulales bacterium]